MVSVYINSLRYSKKVEPLLACLCKGQQFPLSDWVPCLRGSYLA